jgi:hypothetical protein
MPPELKGRKYDIYIALLFSTSMTNMPPQELDTSTAILKKKKKPNSLM